VPKVSDSRRNLFVERTHGARIYHRRAFL